MSGQGRLPAPTGDLRADAMSELRWAMAGRGFTLDKVGSMKSVLALPVVAGAVAHAGEVPPLVAAYETVCDGARRLGNGIHPRVLRNALAIDYDGDAKDLTARRLEFMEQHSDIGQSARSLYDIETRELDALVASLGASLAAATPPPPPPARDPDPGQPWRVDAFEATMRFSGRAVRVAEVVDDVVACQDDLTAYERIYYCTTDRGKPAKLRVLQGGSLSDDRAQGRENFRVATIGFHTPLQTGERHRVWSEVVYPGTGGESEPWVVMHVIRPYRRILFRLQFELEELPSHLWRVDGLIPEARAGDRRSSEPLEMGPFGSVEAEFLDPRQALCYGIAWQW